MRMIGLIFAYLISKLPKSGWFASGPDSAAWQLWTTYWHQNKSIASPVCFHVFCTQRKHIDNEKKALRETQTLRAAYAGAGSILHLCTEFEAENFIRSSCIRGSIISKLGHVTQATPISGVVLYSVRRGRALLRAVRPETSVERPIKPSRIRSVCCRTCQAAQAGNSFSLRPIAFVSRWRDDHSSSWSSFARRSFISASSRKKPCREFVLSICFTLRT